MILDITANDIKQLNDVDLRTLVGKLTEEELRVNNHSPSHVTYGGHQNSGDGGIDVRVSLNSESEISGFVPRAAVGFQVKAQDMPRSEIIKEMTNCSTLKESISELAKISGAYIIVSSQGSLSDKSLKDRKTAMNDAIKSDSNSGNLFIDFYDRQRLATWVNQHPSIIIWLRSKLNISLSGWRAFEDWSSSPEDTQSEYLLDDSIRIHGVRLKDSKSSNAIDAINQIRNILHEPKGSVRLVGLSGVGKTRFAQALFDDRIGNDALNHNQVIYTDLSDNPYPIPQQLFEQIQFKNKRCVFIVDNCGVELHKKLTQAMKITNSQMSLLTIEYDVGDDEPEGSEVFKLEPASNDIIEKVVRRHYPNLTNPEIHTISKFSEGNSRVALALANTAQAGDSLANMKDSELFKRLFHQNHVPDQRLYDAAMACSLVYSFDVENIEGSEAEITLLAELANQTWEDLYKHVAELKKRQLVQSRSVFRAILPHALTHRLAQEALKTFHPTQLRTFISRLPKRMLKSFSKRLGALHDSNEAITVASKWVSDFSKENNQDKWNDLNITILDNIAPVVPEEVLKLIENDIDNILKLPETSSYYEHKIINLLSAIAYDVEYFDRAQDLILKFVKDSKPSNNAGDAINVFSSLFYLVLSGTHATAAQRCNYLRICIIKEDTKFEKLALAGLEAMMQIRHFHSFRSFEFGSRKRDYGFYPSSNKEVQNWFKEVIKLVYELLEIPRLKVRVLEIVTKNFQQLCEDSGIEDELIEFAKFTHKNRNWNDGWRVVRSVSKSKTREKDNIFIEKFRVLEEEFKPNNIEELLRSYILAKNSYDLEYLEEEQDDPEKHSKAAQRITDTCRDIGAQIISVPELLEAKLFEIISSENHRKWDLGFGMGRYCDEPRSIWKLIIDAYKEYPNSVKFNLAGGFLRGLNEIDTALCNELLVEALADVNLHKFYVTFQTSVGLNSASFETLITASKLDTIPVFSFYGIAHGMASVGISGNLIAELISNLLKKDDGFEVSLEIVNMHLYSKASDKIEITDDDKLLAKILLSNAILPKNGNRFGWHLANLVKHNLDNPKDEKIARELCRKLKVGFTDWSISPYDYSKLVQKLSAKFPLVFLDVFFEKGTKKNCWSFQNIFRASRDDQICPVQLVPIELMISWANADKDNRFHLLACSITPFKAKDDTGVDDEGTPIGINNHALALIQNAPEPKEIIVLMSDFIKPMSWSGSRAEIMSHRLSVFKQLKGVLPNTLWADIDAAVNEIQKEVQRERDREDKENRERDERFEW